MLFGDGGARNASDVALFLALVELCVALLDRLDVKMVLRHVHLLYTEVLELAARNAHVSGYYKLARALNGVCERGGYFECGRRSADGTGDGTGDGGVASHTGSAAAGGTAAGGVATGGWRGVSSSDAMDVEAIHGRTIQIGPDSFGISVLSDAADAVRPDAL